MSHYSCQNRISYFSSSHPFTEENIVEKTAELSVQRLKLCRKMVVFSANWSWLWNQLSWIYSKQLRNTGVVIKRKKREEHTTTNSSKCYLHYITSILWKTVKKKWSTTFPFPHSTQPSTLWNTLRTDSMCLNTFPGGKTDQKLCLLVHPLWLLEGLNVNILSTIQALTVQEGKKKLIYDPCEFQLKGIRKKNHLLHSIFLYKPFKSLLVW